MVYRDPVNGWNSTDGLNSFSGEWGQLIRRMVLRHNSDVRLPMVQTSYWNIV